MDQIAAGWSITVLPAQEDEPELGGAPLGSALPERPMEMVVIPVRSRRGVTLGTGITRKPALLEAIRGLPGIGEVRLSPIGGTVGPGGENWLGVAFMARLPHPCPRPLDQLMSGIVEFLGTRLGLRRSELARGRVEGAWCPGFSDLSVGGRKLIGVGFKLTRDAAAVRAIIGVKEPGAAELQALDACHRVFGPGLDPSRLSWLADVLGMPDLDQAAAAGLLQGPPRPWPEKISA